MENILSTIQNNPILILFIIGLIPILFAIILVITGSIDHSASKIVKKHIKTMKEIIDENEEDLKNISSKSAEINSGGIEITSRAIKKGFTDNNDGNKLYCKNCGKQIEEDSKFCRYCGKEQ